MAVNYTEAERIEQIVAVHEMLAAGKTYRWIADRLDISTSTVHDRSREAVKVAEFATGTAARDQVRAEQVTAIRYWIGEVHTQYTAGSVPVSDAVRAFVPLSARLSRLLGLDAPATVQIADQRDTPPPDPELVALIRDAAARGDKTLALNEDPANDGAERY